MTKKKTPKKTPQQRLDELNEQQKKIEQQLKQKRAAIVRQKQQQQAKLTNEKRKIDTRRKVLVGAAVLYRVEAGKWPEAELQAMMNAFLVRNDDRQLFDLPPLPDKPATEPAGETGADDEDLDLFAPETEPKPVTSDQ